MALDAYQAEDTDRNMLENTEPAKERRALPSSIARQILRLGLSLQDSELRLICGTTAILKSLFFFESVDAGTSLRLINIRVLSHAIKIGVELRKNQTAVPHTLFYSRNQAFPLSLNDLSLRRESLRHSLTSLSQ